ncbi:YEATS-associated helix-containing protein [Mucilaginibacter psychrotolerans]|uniref:Uncharacterized protein n=1 Tax=Mucilaginibacter psychrotolerans TaxID=1524096 RepID=A0A4Y8SFE3_9SPHI|nr:YEATS-associated helix-containing protein [Mucilaginibacter psychrotolerans]TFF37267.1 hypothetical protein E2R66_12585 [Mucilaginibacter psychrotolerans]
MSLYFILIIMLFAGVIGGLTNSVLSANINPDTGNQIQSTGRCILIGVGATILVPLFLQIAQSNLLDNIHGDWHVADTLARVASKAPVAKVAKPESGTTTDTVKDSKGKDTSGKSAVVDKPDSKTTVTIKDNGLKAYLIFMGYCFLAAAAGPRFINNLIDGVIKDKQIDKLAKKNAEVTAQKDQVVAEKDKVVEQKNEIEKKQELQTIENRVLAERDESSALRTVSLEPASNKNAVKYIKPQIGPVTVKEDPQKGRFGGKSENNGRALKASVIKSSIPEFYNVSIWVESTDETRPLDTDVMFYLHDSFRPAVYTIKPKEFRNDKAMDAGILSYGAFTVGVVTDNGETLLELDLADDAGFPPEFRRR